MSGYVPEHAYFGADAKCRCPLRERGYMTRKQKKPPKMTERRKQIIDLRLQNKSYGAIAKQLGLSKHYVRDECVLFGLNGVRSNGNHIEDPDKYIQRYTDKLRYVSGWSSCEAFATVQCLDCGNVFDYSMKGLRSQHVIEPCKVCRDREAARKTEEKAELKREEKAEAERLRRLKINYKQKSWKVCPVCNSLFYQTSRKKYCSTRCMNQNKWNMKDGYRYLFPLNEVYKRDQGICYLCGQLCDWNDYYIKDGVIIYGDYYPSRDHVVPKSKGGKNSWGNIKLAHRICNSAKRDSPSVDLIHI